MENILFFKRKHSPFKSANCASGTENVFFFTSCRDTTEDNKHFTFVFDHEGLLRRMIENCK